MENDAESEQEVAREAAQPTSHHDGHSYLLGTLYARHTFFSVSSHVSKTASVGLSPGARVMNKIASWVPFPAHPNLVQVNTPDEIEAVVTDADKLLRKQLLERWDVTAYAYAAWVEGEYATDPPDPLILTHHEALLIAPEVYSHTCHRGMIMIHGPGRKITKLFTGGTGDISVRKRRAIVKDMQFIQKQTPYCNNVLARSEEEREVILERARQHGYALIQIISGTPNHPLKLTVSDGVRRVCDKEQESSIP